MTVGNASTHRPSVEMVPVKLQRTVAAALRTVGPARLSVVTKSVKTLRTALCALRTVANAHLCAEIISARMVRIVTLAHATVGHVKNHLRVETPSVMTTKAVIAAQLIAGNAPQYVGTKAVT